MTDTLSERGAPAVATPPLLRVADLSAGYAARRVLDGISIEVGTGEVVTVLGHNGAGKTTLLKAIFGAIPRGGAVVFDGLTLRSLSYTQAVKRGISFTPATLPVFRDLSVEKNLELGGISLDGRDSRRARIAELQQVFPLMKERAGSLAGTLSGGQQRVLSIAMALMSRPKLMLLDEPSLGIAPSGVQDIFGQIRALADQDGLSVLLVEQNVRASLRIADRVYYIRHGEIILEETAAVAGKRDHWWDLF